MLHVSELHGAATHLSVIAIPLAAVLLVLRRARIGGGAVAAAEPWAVGAAVVGVILAGITGLLARGASQTMLRGDDNAVGSAHFWLGIALAVVVLLPAGYRFWRARGGRAVHAARAAWIALAVVAVVAVALQGYWGGRMTYQHGVGVDRAGELAQTARGTADLELALARGTDPAAAGKRAFSDQGLGCSECHGDQAQGARGPRLAGGKDVEEFRHVHAGGLFPPKVVTDRDFAAVDAYLKTLGPPEHDRGGD